MSRRFAGMLFVLVFSLFAVTACGSGGVLNAVRGSGTVIQETRDVTRFDEIRLGGSGRLIISQGDTFSLTILAEDNIMPLLTSEVSGWNLNLGVQRNTSINPTRTIEYRVTMPNLKGVHLSGSASVEVEEGFAMEQFDLRLSGSSSARVADFTAQRTSINISGSGSVTLAGTSDDLDVNISGSGELNGSELATRRAEIRVSGTGNCTVQVSDSLDVRISGAGHIRYIGDPTVSQQISGIGSVSKSG